MSLGALYRSSLALLTDFYQVTMAYAYWRTGMAEREAVFHLTFRESPFRSGYAIACGTAPAAEFLESLRFAPDDIEYLAGLRSGDGGPMFPTEFLEYLGALELTCDVDVVAEGTVVFAHEPILRVRGPILQAQLVETALLNLVNFQTLIATKASRICHAAAGASVLEFGLRRAQGIDGGLAASRAAYVGGCAATSNVLAGKLYGVPVRGTHAHSWVMAFDDELEAFDAYAQALPQGCVLLVDTYDTLEGVRRAVEAGRRMRERGHELAGVRLDSGDLAVLSAAARRILDEGGFPDAVVVASGDLDEHSIARLRSGGAPVAVFGVGTRLATAHDQPALGGVYKLGAIRGSGGWQLRAKRSDEPAKSTLPGVLQVRRYFTDGRPTGDVICHEGTEPAPGSTAVRVADHSRRWQVPAGGHSESLLVPVIRDGARVASPSSLGEARARAAAQVSSLEAGLRDVPARGEYPVVLEAGLFEDWRRLLGEVES